MISGNDLFQGIFDDTVAFAFQRIFENIEFLTYHIAAQRFVSLNEYEIVIGFVNLIYHIIFLYKNQHKAFVNMPIYSDIKSSL